MLGLGLKLFTATVTTVASSLILSSATSSWNGVVGGDTATLTGVGFAAGGSLRVTFGGYSATNVTVVNSTTITCTTPTVYATGSVDVVLTNGDGGTATLTNGFTYVWDPSLLTNLYWWGLGDRGVTGTTAISSWDRVTGSYTGSLTQGTVANQPSLVTNWLNSRSAINFNFNNHQWLGMSFDTTVLKPVSVSAVLFMSGTASTLQYMWSGVTTTPRAESYYQNSTKALNFYNGGNVSWPVAGFTGSYARNVVVYNGSLGNEYRARTKDQGIVIDSSSFGGNFGGTVGFKVGGRYDNNTVCNFNGAMATFIVTNGAITSGSYDDQMLDSWVKAYYGF